MPSIPTLDLTPSPVYDSDDFTYYAEISRFERLLSDTAKTSFAELERRNPVYSAEITTFPLASAGTSSTVRLLKGWRRHQPLRCAFPSYSEVLELNGEDGTRASGRALCCASYFGQYLSVTLRKVGNSPTIAWNGLRGAAQRSNGYYSGRSKLDQFPIPVYYVADTLASLTLNSVEAKGIIVVFGETAAAKSQMARSLIHLHLMKCKPKGRRPHLVTLEDPIDEWYSKTPEEAAASGIDYTPRQIGVDVADIETGFNDALRQKPSVLFVGEVRRREDWRSILNFAGTGHLIVTTSHAGSLIEAMENLFQAVDAHTPAQMNFVAQRLLAMIHLEPITLGERKVVLPTVWRRTAEGLSGLTAAGLSSIIPKGSAAPADTDSCIGRAFFSTMWQRFEKQRIAGECPKPLGCEAGEEGRSPTLSPQQWDELATRALALDLRKP